jgi:zinc protease
MASSIVGGGFTSRLVDEIRVNRSLTYGIGSRFSARNYGGDFLVSTFTKMETTRALLDATNDVLRKTSRQGVTAAELVKFKSYLAGSFAIQMQRPDAIARQLADVALYGLPTDYLQTYLTRIRAVKLEDVNRITRQYMAPESLSLVLVAPAESVRTQLKGLGDIETRSVNTVGQ